MGTPLTPVCSTVYKTTKTRNGCLPDITCFEKRYGKPWHQDRVGTTVYPSVIGVLTLIDRTFVCGECRPKEFPVLKVAYESKACQACCQR